MSIKACLENVREKSPLIHNITNYVTVNDVANCLLAAGASPIMSDEILDVEDITSICSGLNINIGTLNQNTVESMFVAGIKANELGHAVTLDPVGAGASEMRTQTAKKLIEKLKFNAVRGNISEIKSLFAGTNSTSGVDASIEDRITEENLNAAIEFAKKCALKINSVIVITGATDIVTDGKKTYLIKNGRPEMSKITGTGCQLSALITAFISANRDNELEACASAVIAMGLAGETGFKNLLAGEGNATYRNRIIDAIYNMDGETLEMGAEYEIR